MTDSTWTSERLRRVWEGFFGDRGHAWVSSESLIPHHPTAPMFTNAGMNQFLPIFLGEAPPTDHRVADIQKCVRIMGKHDDIENIGRSKRHGTFFEMLGSWSFGDYFKQGAIEMAWELCTEHLGFDPDQLWVTVHHTDEDAERYWIEHTAVRPDHIQKMGYDDDENFWSMGDTGPCGPSSELHVDRGPSFGPDGGPAHGGEERFLEFWNLVFMQYDRSKEQVLTPLPMQCIDTGAGFERMLSILQGVDTIFETDLFVPLLDVAQSVTGKKMGDDPDVDVSLKILADHARSSTFLINDGVFPSNGDRGYVLRRIIRRAVRRAYSLGVTADVMVPMADAVIERMQAVYPDIRRNEDFIRRILDVEEGNFRSTLQRGLTRLGSVLVDAVATVDGAVAFELHDTHGFPIEVTREIAHERGATIDEAGFAKAMADQRQMAKDAAKKDKGGSINTAAYKDLLEQCGETVFLGHANATATAKVLAVLASSRLSAAGEPDPTQFEIILDRTPFYAEGGGQVGDTGDITTETGAAAVIDTTRGAPGLTRHLVKVLSGTILPGQQAEVAIDADRRTAIQRNHTGTHLLHSALRTVLGDHVKQQGSLVTPDELRFDFSHFGGLTAEETAKIEELVNIEVLGDHGVAVRELTKAEAEAEGAIAFFGEKYGATVRVLDAGPTSKELCGGTHVTALGQIGPLRIAKEESVASGVRRIYATTGTGTLAHARNVEHTLAHAATALKVSPAEVPQAIERLLAERKTLADMVKALESAGLAAEADALVATAQGGVVVVRRDDLAADAMRQLALIVRDRLGDAARAVVLAGSPDGAKVALVAVVPKGQKASSLLADAAKLCGGGAGGNGDVAQAGGRDPSAIDAALDLVRAALA